MNTCETIIQARWIAPVEPAGHVIENGAVAIDAGRLVAIDTREAVAAAWSAQRVIERPDHLLIPGMINAHTHAAMSLMRGIAEDLPLQQWLEQGVWPIEAQHIGPEMVRDGTRLAMLEMIRGGITCFNDMYFFPDIAGEAASDARMRVSVGCPIIDFPTAWGSGPDEYLAKGQAVHDAMVSNPLVTTQFAPHSPYTVSTETLTRIRTVADQLDATVHIHLQETEHEVQQGLGLSNQRPTALLHALGLINANLSAAHMVAANDADLDIFASQHASIVHCPSSNLKLASGLAPVADMLARGINVAIGTDGAASNNALDMIAETRLAGLMAKGRDGDATVLPAATLLQMATLNGARALRIDEDTGSLVAGKWADITAIDLSAVHCQPVYDPVATLIYAANRADVTDVWVAGKALLSDRETTTLDSQRIMARTAEWATRIRA